MADGSLDYDDKTLSELDYVIGSIHLAPEKNVEQRLIAAIRSKKVTFIGHPSCRQFGKREMAIINWDNVFQEAAKHKVGMEINSQPLRLDLPVDLIKHARSRGVRFVVNSDNHGDSFDRHLGLASARKAGLEKFDLLKIEG